MKETQEKRFQEIAELGNLDPWGLAYCTAVSRVKASSNIINCVAFRGVLSDNVDDAINSMLNDRLPDDNINKDEAHHRQIRLEAMIPLRGFAQHRAAENSSLVRRSTESRSG
ncbi:hypothetical protein EVAR_8484_1 [Eumeta japonica]|uniref:Uncharacterized protein n=1 Tax=Eumeta variegata TaxID=151549 RepID=A0A4C1XPI6_EUMVA|nr:hypothetical protein EVAR_8484_1 [Eumeta japonica]